MLLIAIIKNNMFLSQSMTSNYDYFEMVLYSKISEHGLSRWGRKLHIKLIRYTEKKKKIANLKRRQACIKYMAWKDKVSSKF